MRAPALVAFAASASAAHVFAVRDVLARLPACRQDMHDQPKYQAVRGATFFADRAGAARSPTGRWRAASCTPTTRRLHRQDGDGSRVAELPMPVTRELSSAAATASTSSARPATARPATGDGMVVQRGYQPAAESFHVDRLRPRRSATSSTSMTNGFGAMPDYAAQIPRPTAGRSRPTSAPCSSPSAPRWPTSRRGRAPDRPKKPRPRRPPSRDAATAHAPPTEGEPTSAARASDRSLSVASSGRSRPGPRRTIGRVGVALAGVSGSRPRFRSRARQFYRRTFGLRLLDRPRRSARSPPDDPAPDGRRLGRRHPARPLEAATRTLPLMALFFIPIAFGMHPLYEWADPASSRRTS